MERTKRDEQRLLPKHRFKALHHLISDMNG